MKKYIDFINESFYGKIIKNTNTLPEIFEFAIDIRNCSSEKINELFEEFGKFVIIDDESKKDLIAGYNTPWAWRVMLDYTYITINTITTPGWGSGYDYMDDIVTVDEVLSNGLVNIEEHIKMKNNSKKYNI